MNDSRPLSDEKKSGGVTIGDIDGGVRDTIIAGRDVTIGQRITNFFLGSTEQQRAQRNRQAMLKLVKDFWIKGVLEQSLHGAVMIELGLEERPDAVENPWDMVLQTGKERRPLPSGTRIIGVFDEMGGTLLILGEPGSGKTTMLLELARDAIARAEQDPILPIPVVFNLSSWTGQQPIVDWLIEELNTKYSIPRKVAQTWIESDDLLLLLDGLDEVKPECREACVKAINDFRQEHGLMPLVVCSRVADYEALTTRLRLQGAVLLQHLTPRQIDQYLAGAGAELSAVRGVLQRDPRFQELARSPLMLSIMTLAYRGTPAENLRSFESIEAHRRLVFDAYVQRMLGRRSGGRYYSPKQTIHWLRWLAQEMFQHAQSAFLVERLQPSWLRTRAQRWAYNVICGAAVGSSVVLSLGLLMGRFYRLWALGAIVPAAFWITLVFAWVVREQCKPIRPTELKWSWQKARKALILLPVLGLIAGLGIWWIQERRLVGCLIAGFIYGLIIVLVSGLSRTEMEVSVTPNQGIRRSAKNAVILGLVGGLLFGLLQAWANPRWSNILENGLLGLSWAGLFYGGLAVIQHFALRFVLCCNQYIPWDYVRFLNYAAECIFLRRVGGSYIFVHRLLQDYFAVSREDAMAYHNLGIAYHNSGDFEQAVFHLTRAIELDPHNAETYHNRGIAYQACEDYERAIIDYTRAVELAPDAVHYFSRGDAYAKSGEWGKAITDYAQATKLNPKYAATRRRRAVDCVDRGDVHEEAGDLEKALLAYTQAIELDPGYVAAYNNRGNVYADSGDLDKAITDYTLAIRLAPDAIHYGNRGDAYAELGDLEKAMADYTRAIELNPEDAETRNSRGLVRALVGDYSGAIGDFKFFVEWSKKNNLYEFCGSKRESWIAELEAGRNPFGDAPLRELLDE